MDLSFRNLSALVLICIVMLAGVVPGVADWTMQQCDVQDHLYGIYFLDEDNGYAVGWGASDGAVILKTTDGGENWESSVPVRSSLLFSSSFISESTGFMAGYDGVRARAMLLETNDGGESWTPHIFQESMGFYRITFPTPEMGYVCGYDGAILKTETEGWTWDLLDTGTDAVFRVMNFANENAGYAACGSNFAVMNQIYRTLNGGEEWVQIQDFQNMSIGGLWFFDDSTGVLVGWDGGECVYRTTDYGENWERVYSSDEYVVFQAVHFDGDIGYAVTENGRVIQSTDRGEHWEELETTDPPVFLFSVCAVGQNAYAVGESGSIFVRYDEQGVFEKTGTIPTGLSLHQNFPNPFNPTTIISYDLAGEGMVSLKVFDQSGRIVAKLFDGVQSSGQHSAFFNAEDLTPGVYFYRLDTAGESLVRRMNLVK